MYILELLLARMWLITLLFALSLLLYCSKKGLLLYNSSYSYVMSELTHVVTFELLHVHGVILELEL